MSSASNPISAPEHEPAHPSRKGGSRWKYPVLLAVLGGGAYAAYALLNPAPAEQAATAVAIPTEAAFDGPLTKTMRIGGITSSIVFANVRAPTQRGPERRSLVLLELLASGARVTKGEIVGAIDGQGLQDHIDDVHSTVVTSETDIKKRRAEQQVDWNNLNQNLRVAQSTTDKWELEAQAAEIRTVIDREILNLGAEESEAAYAQQQKDLGWQKQGHEAELKILEITTERHRRHVGRHVFDLKRYTVASPMDGMVVRQQIRRSGEWGMVEVGDQLYPGVLFLKIMDTDNMQVEAAINQSESSLLKLGMEAEIGLDAFPGLKLKGKVYSIGALAKSSTQSQYVRQLPVRVKIDGSHAKLIPDLSAYADVVLAREDNVTQVQRCSIFTEDGQSYVFVKNGDKFDKRPVELGLRNNTHVAVTSGLQPGEEVALEHPAG